MMGYSSFKYAIRSKGRPRMIDVVGVAFALAVIVGMLGLTAATILILGWS